MLPNQQSLFYFALKEKTSTSKSWVWETMQNTDKTGMSLLKENKKNTIVI
jgi:hypothetical protein